MLSLTGQEVLQVCPTLSLIPDTARCPVFAFLILSGYTCGKSHSYIHTHLGLAHLDTVETNQAVNFFQFFPLCPLGGHYLLHDPGAACGV